MAFVLLGGMQELIKAQNLFVIEQGKNILDDVSLVVRAHDFITVIGPNGSGKSVLLKCLMGLLSYDRGLIERRSNLRIGYVPQAMVQDNVIPISAGRFLTLRKRATSAQVEQVAIETGIENSLHKPFGSLSGGELQRILLARALLDSPDLLVLDEPAQNLDISGQLSFYKLLREIYEERKLSILMVSHDLHMVMSSSKQVICLFHHICCSGEPQKVTRDPEFISLFGRDMADMMAVYQHSHNHTHDDGGEP